MDLQRLEDEIEIREALQRRTAERHKDLLLNSALVVVLIYAFVQHWFFDRPVCLASLSPQHVHKRRWVRIVCIITAFVALCFLAANS